MHFRPIIADCIRFRSINTARSIRIRTWRVQCSRNCAVNTVPTHGSCERWKCSSHSWWHRRRSNSPKSHIALQWNSTEMSAPNGNYGYAIHIERKLTTSLLAVNKMKIADSPHVGPHRIPYSAIMKSPKNRFIKNVWKIIFALSSYFGHSTLVVHAMDIGSCSCSCSCPFRCAIQLPLNCIAVASHIAFIGVVFFFFVILVDNRHVVFGFQWWWKMFESATNSYSIECRHGQKTAGGVQNDQKCRRKNRNNCRTRHGAAPF